VVVVVTFYCEYLIDTKHNQANLGIFISIQAFPLIPLTRCSYRYALDR
jgi:hypothetical protein